MNTIDMYLLAENARRFLGLAAPLSAAAAITATST